MKENTLSLESLLSIDLQYDVNNNSTQSRTSEKKNKSIHEKKINSRRYNNCLLLRSILPLNFSNILNEIIMQIQNEFELDTLEIQKIINYIFLYFIKLIYDYKFDINNKKYKKLILNKPKKIIKYFTYNIKEIKQIIYYLAGNYNFYYFRKEKIFHNIINSFYDIIENTISKNRLLPDTNPIAQNTRIVNYRDEGVEIIEEYLYLNVESQCTIEDYEPFCNQNINNNISDPEINSDSMI